MLIASAALMAVITGAAALAWRLEPGARLLRALTRLLEAPPEAAVFAVLRGQGVGVSVAQSRLAVVRGVGDIGLIYDLDELVGVELIFDGEVAARMYRGEPRLPLDQTAPHVTTVTLRLAFDDVRDPEFELEILCADDVSRRGAFQALEAVQEGRRWFARLETAVRRSGSSSAAGRYGG